MKKTEPLRVHLRALEDSDLDRTYGWHNDAQLYETLCESFQPASRASVTDWLHRKSARSSSEVNLAVCLQPTGEHVGNIYLRDICWVARRAALHIFIGGSVNRHQGYGQAAIRQILQLAFSDLNLNRVYLEVLADNVAAIKAYEKCGFELEGRLKAHYFKAGQHKDGLVMGISSQKFNNLK